MWLFSNSFRKQFAKLNHFKRTNNNLVANGDFSQGTIGWTNYAGELTSFATENGELKWSQDNVNIGVTPIGTSPKNGIQYRISFKARKSGTASANFRFAFATNGVGAENTTVVINDVMTEYVITVTPSNDYDNFVFGRALSGDGFYFLDDVVIQIV